MKRALLILFSFLFSSMAVSQSLSINTDGSPADNSAMLDIKSANKGMLIPRMTKAQKNAIAAPATGLLVFQQSPDSIGFYYFNGTTWTWLPGNDVLDTISWKRYGNTATNPAVHFIGTVDDQPLSFRQNNTWLGRWNGTTNNYFIGDSAGAKVTTGMFNIGIGDSALFALTSGGRNIAIGNAALRRISSASGLISIGDSSGYNNLAGLQNIFIGEKAGYANMFGGTNILIGANAGKNMSGGEGNVFIGDSTGTSMTTNGAYSSVFIGDKAGSLTNAEPNTFIGNFSGRANTSGEFNSFLGTQSGWQNINGSFNTFLGELSGYDNIAGNNNTFTGFYSGTNSTGSSNVFNGHRAGLTNTSGSGNTILGSDANVLKNNLTNASAIGYRAAVDTSNALVLGSVIGVNSATSHTNVGIGIAKPLAMLHVKDSSVLFTGTYPYGAATSDPPVSGPGVRMMWYPSKGAFRVGHVSGTNWDKDSIGYSSFASGDNTRATGVASTAMGGGSIAAGVYSTALGAFSIAGANYSTAIGTSNYTAAGFSTTIGFSNYAFGDYGVSIGRNSVATGESSIALGQFATANGINSIALGLNSYAYGHGSAAIAGAASYGNQATAISGGAAYGNNSIALGGGITSGFRSVAMGLTTARPYVSLTIGRYNDTLAGSSQSTWVDTDPVFIIGNGTSNAARSNAFTVLKNANTGINISDPLALLHMKAKEATYNMHIRLENLGNTDYASMVYDGSMKFRTFGVDDEYQWRNLANTTTMRLTNAGELGINTATPDALLDASGTFKLGTNGTVNNAILRDTVLINPGSIPANGELDVTIALANATINGAVSISPSADIESGIIIAWARVSGAGLVKIRYRNLTGAAINPAAINYYISVVQ